MKALSGPKDNPDLETYEGAELHTELGPDDERLDDEKTDDRYNS